MSADGLGENASEAGLAASRWSPEQNRAQMAAFKGPAQGSSVPDELLVAYDFVEGSGAHPSGQRLSTGRRGEDGLLLAVVVCRRVGRASRCHVSMLQAGRPPGATDTDRSAKERAGTAFEAWRNRHPALRGSISGSGAALADRHHVEDVDQDEDDGEDAGQGTADDEDPPHVSHDVRVLLGGFRC